jgi:hypothetical protein
VRQCDFQSSNFTFFWLAGRMVMEGENPYDETQYLAGHETYGIKWQPNKIFPYPLPLAIFCIPLGLLSLRIYYMASYHACIVAMTILFIHWKEVAPNDYLSPFCLDVFFGPLSHFTYRLDWGLQCWQWSGRFSC